MICCYVNKILNLTINALNNILTTTAITITPASTKITTKAITLRIIFDYNKVSISSTFYARIFPKKVLHPAFL